MISLQIPAVFFATMATDILFALYVRRTAQGSALSAAIYGTTILLFAAYVTISYVANPWMVLPSAAGGFIGTYAVVRMDKGSGK